MQLYGISFMHLYKQSGRWQDTSGYVIIYSIKHILTYPDVDQTAYMDAWKNSRQTACTSLPKDEHFVVPGYV